MNLGTDIVYSLELNIVDDNYPKGIHSPERSHMLKLVTIYFILARSVLLVVRTMGMQSRNVDTGLVITKINNLFC